MSTTLQVASAPELLTPECPLPFAGVPDLLLADRTRAELFRVIGRTRGLFAGLNDWPFLDDAFQAKSKSVLATVGHDRWAASGGTLTPDGRHGCTPVSELAAEVVQELAVRHGGVLWRDASGVVRAVNLLPGVGGGEGLTALTLASFETPSPPPLLKKGRRDNKLSAATRLALNTQASGLRLMARAEQLYWAIFAEVQRQRTSTVLLPDVALRHLVWGADRWPADWRQEVIATLTSMMALRLEVFRLAATGWNPRFGSASVLLEHVEHLWVNDPAADRGCDPRCCLWRGPRHHHFRVGIGKGFLGVLERLYTGLGEQGREFDFFRPLPDEEGRTAGEKGHRPPDVVRVNLPAAMYGPAVWSDLSDGEVGVYRGLAAELTRGRSVKDPVQVLTGNRVPDLAAKKLIPCPLLDARGRYVVFGGNGIRAGAGYKIVGNDGRGWVYKCGQQVPEDASPVEVCRAVRAFLADLRCLAGRFYLVAAGLVVRSGCVEWLALDEMVALSRRQAGVDHLLGVHLRVYGPHDHLSRCREYFAECGGFATGSPVEDETVEVKTAVVADVGVRITRAGLTQSQVADRLGVSPAFISQVVNNRRRLPPRLAGRLNRMLAKHREK